MKEPILQSILAGTRQAVTFSHPIYNLATGELKAREILTRFDNGQGHMVTVGAFLSDMTLNPELRVELDLRCLQTIFEALAKHPITDHLIFINVDPLTLNHPVFWYRIQPWLWNLSIPPHRIVLEITESHSLHHLDSLYGFARRLRDMEFRIAVDDVGSGVASLSHMSRLTPDFIKVDRSLVQEVNRRPYQAALLNALAVFAQRMRIGCIAEGIETEEELHTIMDADVPLGQGFLFGRPQPLEFEP